MGKNTKRPRNDDSSSTSSSKLQPSKKPHSSSVSSSRQTKDINTHHRSSQHSEQKSKLSTFPSYLEVPGLPPKVKLSCEIIATTPSVTVERILEDRGISVSQEDVEGVLKLSYGFPGPAVKFFRWADYQLRDEHSPYAWNLVIDILGKDGQFDAMWDAIKSMRKEELLSLSNFSSVFGSYVIANRVLEAIMTFEVMDQYGFPRDIVAFNSLLSPICREGKTQEAKEFVDTVKGRIRFDADTYAILFEGRENEKNVVGARDTFSEMVVDVGWDPGNLPAYDSYLTTLLKAIEDCSRKNDAKNAGLIWEVMLKKDDFLPDTEMYNLMIGLNCIVKEFDVAGKLLNEMIYHGVFPNSETYNLYFYYLLKSRKLKEASSIFSEMMKNEFVPNHSNCSSAVRNFVDGGDPYTAIKVWKCMIENYNFDLEETGNLLVLSLRGMNRLPEALKYAEDMIECRIKLTPPTLSKLKQSLVQKGKLAVYDELLRKWKA
ncbi:OLC1v1010640C1 [Oldenlandia corymbosa var. corymbosa]|uniref:OLC1v1010640C1 n=1 Tax=Oldenlandia corymbosa var. corymbosa TaxID=529605 RepID=A0AAV1DRT1_OLDCO|nr:OLC1v1010640C1 [Oldenlandia corymbosa var. corymbosa]